MDPSVRQSVYEALLDSIDRLYALAYRLTNRSDLAEDAVQETARKALQSIPHLRDRRKIRTWLFKILVNCVRDYFRRTREWDELVPENERAEVHSDVSLISRATAHDVRCALARLAPARRAVVLLVDIEDFTIAEAAAMLEIPPGTVASRLARAREDLRRLLRAYRPQFSEGGGTS
jgi:RNA polymerase sigma-70 factor (ECF subfamily)